MTPGTVAHQASLSLTISWSSPKFMSIALVMPSSHQSFQWIRWPEYWSFSFSISPSNESVQLLSYVWLCVISWTAAHQASLSVTNSQSLFKLMSIEVVMPSSHLILWHPLLLLPSIFPSIRDFSNELAVRIRGPKYWSFSFSISPSNEYSGLISFGIDWFDLAVLGTLKSLLQHRGSETSAGY